MLDREDSVLLLPQDAPGRMLLASCSRCFGGYAAPGQLAAWPLMTLTFSVPVVSQVFFHRLTARTAYKTFMTNQSRSAAKKKKKAPPTQTSEPAAPWAGTVTSPVGENETPVHEISSCDSPKPVNEGAEDREEEAATDDSVSLSNSLPLASQSDHSAPRRHCNAEECLSGARCHCRAGQAQLLSCPCC